MKIKYTYKQKVYLLISGSVLFLFLCYQLAFKKTIIEYDTLKINRQQFSLIEAAPLKFKELQQKVTDLERITNSRTTANNNYQVQLLEISTASIAESETRIVEFPRISTFSDKDLITKTQEIAFQGGFIDLLKLLFELGKDSRVGNICCVDFYTQKEPRSGIQTLKMKIFFQTINEEK